MQMAIDEPQRLAPVRRFQVLDTPPDGALDHTPALAGGQGWFDHE